MPGPIIDSQDMFKSGDMAERPTKEEEKQMVMSTLYKVMEEVLYPNYYPNLQAVERFRAADFAERIAEVLVKRSISVIMPRKFTSVGKDFIETELSIYILGNREDLKITIADKQPVSVPVDYYDKAIHQKKAQLGVALVEKLFSVEEDTDEQE